jgi:uncharacterized membrane protein
MKTAVNVNTPERWASAIGGAALAVAGLRRMADDDKARGGLMAVTAAGLLWRGATGHCAVYEASGVDTAHGSSDTRARLGGSRGVDVHEAVTIDRTAPELYRRWRNFEWLAGVFPDVARVEILDDTRSRWKVKGPGGRTFGWVAEIINEIPGRLIAWQTMPGSQIASAGSVHFESAPGDRGTVVRIRAQYDPPGGRLGAAAAWLTGHGLAQEVREGLRRFKGLMESGEVATNAMRPAGRRR